MGILSHWGNHTRKYQSQELCYVCYDTKPYCYIIYYNIVQIHACLLPGKTGGLAISGYWAA